MKQNSVIILVFILIILGVWFMLGRGAGPESLNDTYGYGEGDTMNTNTTDEEKPITNNNEEQKNMKATLHTNKGEITIELFTEQVPNTAANFADLAKKGFYDGTKFHRVIKGFMIQGGDPLSKDDSKAAMWGTGGPGYKFNDEITPANNNAIGTISMANAGPNTNGSQFFINTAANNFLDGKHTVFGRVVSGMEVVTAIENTKTGSNDRPIDAMVINKITIE